MLLGKSSRLWDAEIHFCFESSLSCISPSSHQLSVGGRYLLLLLADVLSDGSRFSWTYVRESPPQGLASC